MAVYRKGEKWVADFWIGGSDGRRIRKGAPTRKLAESIEREYKTRELRGSLVIIMEDTQEILTPQGKIRKAAWLRLEAARLIREAEEELKRRNYELHKAEIIRRGREASALIFAD